MVWLGAIAELTSVGATTFMSLIGSARMRVTRRHRRLRWTAWPDWTSCPPVRTTCDASSRRRRSRSLSLSTASPRRRCKSEHSQRCRQVAAQYRCRLHRIDFRQGEKRLADEVSDRPQLKDFRSAMISAASDSNNAKHRQRRQRALPEPPTGRRQQSAQRRSIGKISVRPATLRHR
jgi:hypothetical protein